MGFLRELNKWKLQTCGWFVNAKLSIVLWNKALKHLSKNHYETSLSFYKWSHLNVSMCKMDSCNKRSELATPFMLWKHLQKFFLCFDRLTFDDCPRNGVQCLAKFVLLFPVKLNKRPPIWKITQLKSIFINKMHQVYPMAPTAQ